MTESEKIIIFELEQALYQVLKENFKEKSEPETIKNPFIIIQSEIDEYLNYVPNEIINNFTKELKNKIQDKLFELNLNVPENFKKE